MRRTRLALSLTLAFARLALRSALTTLVLVRRLRALPLLAAAARHLDVAHADLRWRK